MASARDKSVRLADGVTHSGSNNNNGNSGVHTWYYPGNGLGLARINSAYRTADLTHPSFMMEEKVLVDRR